MPVLDICKFEQVVVKCAGQQFPNYKSMGPFCPKTICSQSPTSTMLHMKYDQDWPDALGDIHV